MVFVSRMRYHIRCVHRNTLTGNFAPSLYRHHQQHVGRWARRYLEEHVVWVL
jgi:hypothetical protein